MAWDGVREVPQLSVNVAPDEDVVFLGRDVFQDVRHGHGMRIHFLFSCRLFRSRKSRGRRMEMVRRSRKSRIAYQMGIGWSFRLACTLRCLVTPFLDAVKEKGR